MPHARYVAFCLALLPALAAPRFVEAGDLVVVWLTDGRMLAGEVDPRTDDQRLWLRSASPTFVIATSAAWEHIKAVNANGERMPIDEFAKRVAEFRPRPADAEALPALAHEVNERPTATPNRPSAQPRAATQVVTLDVEARVANWDQDAATDGVEIRVFPRNAAGETVPVSGQITATLIARAQLPAHDPEAFPQLGRWSLRADENDFGPSGAVYQLPFRGTPPDQDFSLDPVGLVEVSFYVHGQGRVTCDATVYLRGFNPIRHDMQWNAVNRDR